LELAQPQGDGHSLRVHLEAAARQNGQEPGLAGPELPDLYADLWEGFLELDRARGHGSFGPEPLAYADIESWARLTRRRLSPQDVALIVELDRLGFAVRAEGKKK
jgi:hypothetical protein